MFVRKKELSDADLDFVWKAMDNDRSGSISLTEVKSDRRIAKPRSNTGFWGGVQFIEFAQGGVNADSKDEKAASMKAAQLTLEGCALHKSGKLEDCIPKYLSALNHLSNKCGERARCVMARSMTPPPRRRARFVTLNNLANAYSQRAQKDAGDRKNLEASALTMWREALKIEEGENDRQGAAFHSGELLLKNNELTDAIKMFKLVLTLGENTAFGTKAHEKLGVALREAGYQRRMQTNR